MQNRYQYQGQYQTSSTESLRYKRPVFITLTLGYKL